MPIFFFTGALPPALAGGGGGPAGIGGDTGAVDNAALTADGTDGDTIQASPVTISPGGEVVGITRLDADNLRLDGSTLSSTDLNGPIILDPNGSGAVRIASGALLQIGGSAVGDPAFKSTHDGFLLLRTADDSAYIPNVIGGIYRVVVEGTPSARVGEGGLELRASGQILFSSTTDATQAKDTGTKRVGAGTLLDTDGGAGLGRRLTGRVVEAETAGVGSPRAVTALESRKLFTNEGAGAEVFITLPAAAAGVGPFGFCAQNANGIRATAAAGDTIRIEGVASAAGGFIRSSTVGSMIWLECINGTEWVASAKPAGVWTIDA